MGYVRCEKGDCHLGFCTLEVFFGQGSRPKNRDSPLDSNIFNKNELRLRQCHSGMTKTIDIQVWALITASATFGHRQRNREPKSAPILYFSSTSTLIK